jgi:hypothetical protein
MQAEIYEIIAQKLKEALNPNLDNQNPKRIALCTELFQLFLSEAGRELMQWKSPGMERLQLKILEKIEEFAPFNVARVNAEYMEAAEALKVMLENKVRVVMQE